MIMVVLFIRSVGTAFHTPALTATTPLLVPKEQLTRCAGYSQSLQSISYILSPAVAAFLYGIWELNAIIVIDVVVGLDACSTLACVHIPQVGREEESPERKFIREMKDGLMTLRENKGLFALLLVGTLYMFIYMPINALYPLMSMDYFSGTPLHASISEIALPQHVVGGLSLALGALKRDPFYDCLDLADGISLASPDCFLSMDLLYLPSVAY